MKKLIWDSDFFGFDVYQIQYDSNLKLPKGFFYMQGEFDNLKKFNTEKYASSYLDEKIIFKKKITSFTDIRLPLENQLKEITIVDNKLLSIARLSGKFSRFKKDHTLQAYFNKFYDIWVYNSIHKSFADIVLGFYNSDKLLGFVSIKIKDNYGQIGLIAVDSLSQGKGIGKILVIAAENYVFKQKKEYLKIPTQIKNEKACNFYTYLNYKVVKKEYLLQINNL